MTNLQWEQTLRELALAQLKDLRLQVNRTELSLPKLDDHTRDLMKASKAIDEKLIEALEELIIKGVE